jgi:26S proteasome regulatory subunit N9
MSREEIYLRELASEVEKEDERVGEKLFELCSYYNRRLWHQLTLLLAELVSSEPVLVPRLSELYEKFVVACGTRLNQLKYVEIALEIAARSKQDAAQNIEFLKSILALDAVAADQQASVLCKSALGLAILKSTASPASTHEASSSSSSSSSSSTTTSSSRQELISSVKKLIDVLRVEHDALPSGAESVVHAAFFKLLADFYMLSGPAEKFFDNALLYLAHKPLDKIGGAEQRALAFDLCLASLVGENIYNFGQLLSHDILAALRDDDGDAAVDDGDDSKAWVVELLGAFNRGDIADYDRIVGANEAALASLATLVRNKGLMKRKIQTLALMELVFKRPRDERVLSFADISAETKVPLDAVELLVIKALSLKLIRGTIDQVDQIVTVTWVQPRVLDLQQIDSMRARLTDWSAVVDQTLLSLEQEI